MGNVNGRVLALIMVLYQIDGVVRLPRLKIANQR
jgi:hypothetical protein